MIAGLEELMDRMPAALSGGQRQPVAMGRAIVRSQDVFRFADMDGTEVHAKMLHPRLVQPGERLTFKLMLSKCHLFDAETTRAIR